MNKNTEEVLELVDAGTGGILGIATRLSNGRVLVDQSTHPYAVVADVRGIDLWTHLRSIGNGYVYVRVQTPQ